MSLQLNFAAQLIRTKIRKGISKHSEVVGELKPGTYLSMPPPPPCARTPPDPLCADLDLRTVTVAAPTILDR